jgi:mannosyl-3-phosphoglycerate phosphatase
MKNLLKLVVFSDLDGTLLDHVTYQWDAARPALQRLEALGIPVVLASSKTASEIRPLQEQMGLTGLPAIVENGAGVIGLHDTDPADACSALRDALDRIPTHLRTQFRGFGDMTVSELARLTGLPQDAAQLAKARDYSEPGVWSGNDAELAQFHTHLQEHGITAQRGGRFLTLSFGRTKASAMDSVIDALGAKKTLALGDAPNDIAMLERTDMGVIIANPHRPPLPELAGERDGRITRTNDAGPVGWNASVNAILDTLPLVEGHKPDG